MRDKKTPKIQRQEIAINWWSMVPIECQQEPPIWGVVKKENLFTANSSTARQHSCEKSMAVQQLRSQAVLCHAPPRLGSSALVRPLLCFSAHRIHTLFTGKCALWATWEPANMNRSLHPWSLIGLSSCKWGLQILTVGLVQRHCLDWSLWLIGAVQLWLDGANLNPIG